MIGKYCSEILLLFESEIFQENHQNRRNQQIDILCEEVASLLIKLASIIYKDI